MRRGLVQAALGRKNKNKRKDRRVPEKRAARRKRGVGEVGKLNGLNRRGPAPQEFVNLQ